MTGDVEVVTLVELTHVSWVARCVFGWGGGGGGGGVQQGRGEGTRSPSVAAPVRIGNPGFPAIAKKRQIASIMGAVS